MSGDRLVGVTPDVRCATAQPCGPVVVDDGTGESAAPATCYQSAAEQLADLLALLDGLLRRELVRNPSCGAGDISVLAAIGVEEVQQLLAIPGAAAHPSAFAHTAVQRRVDWLRGRLHDRLIRSAAEGIRLPMVELRQLFALSPLEMDLVTACLAVEVDRRYERIYGCLQHDLGRKQPSAGLLMNLCAERPEDGLAVRASLQPLAPLRRYRILELVDDGLASPQLAKPLCIDERVVSFLLGDKTIDARVAMYVSQFDAAAQAARLTQPQRDKLPGLVDQAQRCLRSGAPRERLVAYLHGPRQAGAEAMVAATADALGLPVLTVDAEALPAADAEFDAAVFLLFREGLLSQAVMFFQGLGRALLQDPNKLRWRALVRWAAEMGSIVFISSEQPWRWAPLPLPLVLLPVELPSEGLSDQLAMWRTLVDDQVAEDDLRRLVSRHAMPAGAITAAWRMAQALAALRGPQAAVTLPDLAASAQAQARQVTSSLAQRIEPRHDWADIVLPPLQLEQLQAICSQAKHLCTVYGTWGFERKLSLGKGLNALFSGPSGTGKTLAAEVIAADLLAPLLKIDLSQVVSKYIGETEKNLRQLFDQAAEANAILFFDEADALLGKRSEVKDAHDRYANTEVAYLLQKMEEYEGITILSTNLRQNMDEAFTRRMRFIVEFPFPQEDYRLRIWEGVWPREVPLAEDVDLPWMARQFRLSGGSIRNVALAAAFLAADQDQSVGNHHLVAATKREMHKMGRLVNDEEYRRHG